MVVRVAQGQGLHRDGQHLGLSYFDTEIRRRLWWHICILDMLCSGDQGTDSQIQPGMFDTRLPSNVDCDVLYPSLTEMPLEKVGCTDITLCIVQCEIIASLYWPNKSTGANLSRNNQENLVKSLAYRLENQYLKHLDLEIPVQWMYATIARLTLSKSWLLAHCKTSTMGEDGPAMSQETDDKAFNMAIEVVKFAHLLHTNESTSQWAWLSKSYKQWHAIAFILSELCTRLITPETNHAWEVVTEVYRQWEDDDTQTSLMLRKPISRLMEHAALSRAAKMPFNQLAGSSPSIGAPLGEPASNSEILSPGMYGLPLSGMEWLCEPLL